MAVFWTIQALVEYLKALARNVIPWTLSYLQTFDGKMKTMTLENFQGKIKLIIT